MNDAETTFQAGLAAMKQKDYAAAAEAFQLSNKADPSPGTQINLALAYEKQKKWASAWTWYRSAYGLAQQRGQAAREKNAEESADRVKPMIHYVVVAVSEPLQNVVAKRDGAEVTIAIAGKEVPLPIDPGEHTIEVSAAGKKPWSKTIQIADTPATDRVEVPKLENLPVEEKPATPAAGADYRPPVVVTNDGSGQRTVGIVVGGAGILAGIAAVGMLVVAHGQANNRDEQTKLANTSTGENRTRSLASAKTFDDAAHNDQLIAIILGAGAAVLVGTGAVLYFTAPKHTEKAAKTRVLPLMGPNFAGLGLGGAF